MCHVKCRSRLAPALTQQEEVYLRSLSDVASSVLGVDVQQAGEQGVQQLLSLARLAFNPTAQVHCCSAFTASMTHLCSRKAPCYAPSNHQRMPAKTTKAYQTSHTAVA